MRSTTPPEPAPGKGMDFLPNAAAETPESILNTFTGTQSETPLQYGSNRELLFDPYCFSTFNLLCWNLNWITHFWLIVRLQRLRLHWPVH